MLTQNDLSAIAKVIDKKLSTDIAAIQTRLADLETGRITKIDILQLRSLLTSVERRVTAIESKLDKNITEEQLKKALRGVVRKKDLRAMENRITKKINYVVDSFDGRIIRIESHLHLPSTSN